MPTLCHSLQELSTSKIVNLKFNSLHLDQKMVLIRKNKSWEIPESLAIDEADFWNRRTFLKSAGLRAPVNCQTYASR